VVSDEVTEQVRAHLHRVALVQPETVATVARVRLETAAAHEIRVQVEIVVAIQETKIQEAKAQDETKALADEIRDLVAMAAEAIVQAIHRPTMVEHQVSHREAETFHTKARTMLKFIQLDTTLLLLLPLSAS